MATSGEGFPEIVPGCPPLDVSNRAILQIAEHGLLLSKSQGPLRSCVGCCNCITSSCRWNFWCRNHPTIMCRFWSASMGTAPTEEAKALRVNFEWIFCLLKNQSSPHFFMYRYRTVHCTVQRSGHNRIKKGSSQKIEEKYNETSQHKSVNDE